MCDGWTVISNEWSVMNDEWWLMDDGWCVVSEDSRSDEWCALNMLERTHIPWTCWRYCSPGESRIQHQRSSEWVRLEGRVLPRLSTSLLGLFEYQHHHHISHKQLRKHYKSLKYLEAGFQGFKGKFSSRGLREEMLRSRGREMLSGSK